MSHNALLERSDDPGVRAHLAAAKRIDALMEVLDADPDEFAKVAAALDPPMPAGVGYDGCGDCDIRETLVAAWPILMEAARAEIADEPVPA
jgi:hypothetical protein